MSDHMQDNGIGIIMNAARLATKDIVKIIKKRLEIITRDGAQVETDHQSYTQLIKETWIRCAWFAKKCACKKSL